jgi:hypothetical protein
MKSVPGMIKAGNIDLSKRPIVHHAGGGESSLYSGSFPLSELTGKDKDMNQEVLVPFVTQDGKMLVDPKTGKGDANAARDYAKKTGQILGIFSSPDAATAYSEFLHNKQGAFQVWKNGGKYNPPAETYDSWKDPD